MIPVIEFDVRRPDIWRWYANAANPAVIFRVPRKELVAPILYIQFTMEIVMHFICIMPQAALIMGGLSPQISRGPRYVALFPEIL